MQDRIRTITPRNAIAAPRQQVSGQKPTSPELPRARRKASISEEIAKEITALAQEYARRIDDGGRELGEKPGRSGGDRSGGKVGKAFHVPKKALEIAERFAAKHRTSRDTRDCTVASHARCPAHGKADSYLEFVTPLIKAGGQAPPLNGAFSSNMQVLEYAIKFGISLPVPVPDADSPTGMSVTELYRYRAALRRPNDTNEYIRLHSTFSSNLPPEEADSRWTIYKVLSACMARGICGMEEIKIEGAKSVPAGARDIRRPKVVGEWGAPAAGSRADSLERALEGGIRFKAGMDAIQHIISARLAIPIIRCSPASAGGMAVTGAMEYRFELSDGSASDIWMLYEHLARKFKGTDMRDVYSIFGLACSLAKEGLITVKSMETVAVNPHIGVY